MNPILRDINFQQIEYQNQPMWLLQDPLELSEQQLIFPYHLARMVSECNGQLSAEDLHRQLCAEAQQPVPFDVVTDTLKTLDENFLLDNERSHQAVNRLKEAYLAQPYRPPAFAGLNYPKDPTELHDFLENYSQDDTALADWPGWNGRGIVSPHIDYQRGGHVYAKVWQRAKKAVDSAELILIWGTDHSGGRASLTLSHLPYATPYGVLPTNTELVDQLANAIGEHNAYRLELNHKREHSIELSAVWLHHFMRENPKPVVPILIGSFYHFTPDSHPIQDPNLVKFIDTLKQATAGKRVLNVASVDLSHVGPAFDHDYLMDRERKRTLRGTDSAVMGAIARGDREDFYRQIARTRNANNICGFSPVYLMLSYMGDTSGHRIAYDQCSADRNDTSIVSICGMLLN